MKKASLWLITTAMVTVLLSACSDGGTNNPDPASPEPNASENTTDNGGNAGAEGGVYDNGLSSEEDVVLKMGYWESGSGRTWLDQAIADFTEKYPNVSFDVTSTPTLETILEPMIAAGDDEDMFDIFIPRLAAGGALERLVEAGKLEPQDDLWEREVPGTPGTTVRSIISDDSYDSATGMGTTVRMPIGGYTAGLFYDQQLFDEKGWNKNPTTKDEFIALMEQIKADGITPITFPGVYAGYLTDYVFDTLKFSLANENGHIDEFISNFRNYEGPQHASPENLEAWNLMYEFGQKGYFPSGVAALNHTQSQMQVLQHKAALVATGDWVGNEMKESTPEGFTWGFMTLPVSNNPNQTIFVNSGDAGLGFVIWKEKPDLTKQWAKEFVLSLYEWDIQEAIAVEAGAYPARTDFSEDESRIAKLQPTQAAVAEYVAGRDVVYISYRRNFSLTSPEAGQAHKIVSELITAVATGRTDPSPVLEEADQLLQSAIEKDRP